MAEAPHAGANSWRPGHHEYHFQDGETPDANPSWAYAVEPNYSTPAGGAPQQDVYTTDADGYACCTACGAYHYEEGAEGDDSETEDEFGQEMTAEEVEEFAGDLSGCTVAQLQSEYMFAKVAFARLCRRVRGGTAFQGRLPGPFAKAQATRARDKGVEALTVKAS